MLQQIPLEVLRIILSEIPLDGVKYKRTRTRFVCKKAALSPLSMTCHRLREIVLPILFEEITLVTNSVFLRRLDGLEGVKESLTAPANSDIITYVRNVDLNIQTSDVGRPDVEDGMANFLSHILDHLPSLRTMQLQAYADVAFSTCVLESIRTHTQLQRVTLEVLDFSFGYDQTCIPLLPHPLDGKYVVKTAYFDGNFDADEAEDVLEQWQHVLAQGIRVHTLFVQGLYVVDTWLGTTFSGLKRLETHQAFPGANSSSTDSAPASIDKFLELHPELESLRCLDIRGSYSDSELPEEWGLSPFVGPVLQVFSGSCWDVDFVEVRRGERNKDFRCTEISILLSSDTPKSILPLLRSHSCTSIKTMHVEIEHFGVKVAEFIQYMRVTVDEMLSQDGMAFDGSLVNIYFWWHLGGTYVREESADRFSEDLLTAFKVITHNISFRFPSIRRVHHQVELDNPSMKNNVLSFLFDVNRSLDGENVLEVDLKSKGGHRLNVELNQDEDTSDEELYSDEEMDSDEELDSDEEGNSGSDSDEEANDSG